MGNRATKPIGTEEVTEEGEEEDRRKVPQSGAISRSVSTSSSSSDESINTSSFGPDLVNEDRQVVEKERTNYLCSIPSSTLGQCIDIPPVLALYRKEDPLLLRNDDDGMEDDEDYIEKFKYGCSDEQQQMHGQQSPSSVGTRQQQQRGRGRRISETLSCSTRILSRRRSWSPKSSTDRLGFFSKYSKYSQNSSSTSSITSLLLTNNNPTGYNEEERAMVDGHLPTAESDLNRLRDYFIITTAALPWFTGTAINPLLRAASLSRYQRRQFTPNRSTVTLVVPWLEVEEDRVALYGESWRDKTQVDQEVFIRKWLSESDMEEEAAPASSGGIRILWYPSRFHPKLSSIFAMGDLCEFIVTQNNLTIPKDAVAVLEEPEHLHFYRNTNIRDHFSFVVGIIHTNYKAYASSAIPGGSLITGPLIASISSWLVRAYCDKVIKLSSVLQSFDCPEKEIVCNTHGIRNDFIQEGERRARESYNNNNTSTATTTLAENQGEGKIYFVGKLLWQKGLDKLLELEALYRSMTGDYFPIDIYGSGPDQEDIEQAFGNAGSFLGRRSNSHAKLEGMPSTEDDLSPENSTPDGSNDNGNNTSSNNNNRRGLGYVSTLIRPKPPVPANFKGREDHAKLSKEYKIFVNPSVTEVLCTTTAEATAMGKFVIIPDHPSNFFFQQFPNCLLYKTKSEFVEFLNYAIYHDPEPLRDELIHQLTWEAATERFIRAAAITRRDFAWRERRGKTKSDEKLAKIHYQLGRGAKGDVIRKVLGGGPVAQQNQYEMQRTQSEDPLSEEEENNKPEGVERNDHLE